MQIKQPKYRSEARLYFGSKYFTLKRNMQWLFSKNNWTNLSNQQLSNNVIEHKSFLLRPLKNVDMQLQYNKIENLRIAISRLNTILIKPNETFSFWKVVGKTTASKGYKTGLILKNGKISSGIGGGLCQLGNLLYWMFLHTPLTVTERWRHSFDVFPDINRKIPFGSGATLLYNYIDLVCVNKTSQSFQLNLWIDDEYLRGSINSDCELDVNYKIYEKNHKFESQF